MIVGNLMMISSDGHTTARMDDYRGYLDDEFRDEFDAFLVEYRIKGSRNFDPPALRQRLDPDLVEAWTENMVDSGRLEGSSDPHARLRELDRERICAEVLFPDFGLPFELYSPGLAAAKGYPPPDRVHARAAKQAHNRWLADFCSVAPERFAGMATVDWTDVDDAVREIRWAKNAGLRGVVLPFFDPAEPLYHPRYDKVWATLEDLEMVANSHQALSGTSNVPAMTSGVRHPASAIRLSAGWLLFIVHDLLPHLIWGGVLERFPNLTFVMTESGSSWIVATLEDMDYAYKGSYLRSDIREALPNSPSEYFERQCYLGSSIFSRAEIEGRHRIGLQKMMLGADYPHHEGTVNSGTIDYLRATLGATGVPEGEARIMLGETAAKVFRFDTDALAPISARLALDADDILRSPEKELFPLGDVQKPFV
jgi:predicted TIM-barrel fold metal-dependent hydrolase